MFGKSPFGSNTTNSAFGGTSSLFGSTPNNSAFGVQTTQSGGLFGQKSLFGSTTNTQSTSLFGNVPTSSTSASLFGQSKPLFGSSTTSQPSAFGSSGTSLFGKPQNTQSGGLFGSTFASSVQTGTTIKFEPPTATDTMLRNGANQNINTKHMCISAMKQYEGKSLEVGITVGLVLIKQ
ncbi:hypothetical protein AB6A40_002328 [Gnathostoma spinigerum]|uniref:Nuclear pore complex protein Nup98-Nup96 n=1 Tax=Gnathostoma spinigerum TaxID=75299 RepID=A0ABD6EE38_9BILA